MRTIEHFTICLLGKIVNVRLKNVVCIIRLLGIMGFFQKVSWEQYIAKMK